MLSLEPTDNQATPAFHDVEACKKWLSQLQLTNIGMAQGNLRKQIEELNRYAMKAEARFSILELLRDPVAQLQSDFAKRLIGKPLPLTDDEHLLLTALTSLWQAMQNGYLRCLQSADTHMEKKRAMLWQRSLYYGMQQIFEFTRAGYEPDRATWQQFHALYLNVESSGLKNETVKDERFHNKFPVNCQTLYLAALLMHRTRLLGLTREQRHTAEHWLLLWADTLTLLPRCTATKEDAPPLVVDLEGYRGLQSAAHARASTGMRCLPMVPLSKQIRIKTILLQQGQTPKKVELATDLPGKECIDLLGKLHQCWCEARTDTLIEMPRETSAVNMCVGLEKIYSHIAQKPFKPVKDVGKAMQDAQTQIATFGRVLDETGQHNLKELGFIPEAWLVEENTLLRGRLLRHSPTGDRMAAHHIISIFTADSPAHKAGVIDRIEVAHSGQLYVTVHYLPGQPQAVIANAPESPQAMLKSGSVPCLILPAMEKLRIPASLVMPRDWFQAGREIELTRVDRSKQKVKLGISVERGVDYERVSFKLA
ncbi:MAG: hypothetical protein KJ850_04450 [Gammaproteobacteria bacterium]|nr:hypothetical protein [Gammaproteobacteria bacterium]MBU1624281.1 hypothetical protein [Gammaproteobacteria bacterium]MBU1981009.1 hypothetical protein [Gammaproteobacteria bacterium]